MKIAMVMRTIDRSPKKNYLGQTIRNLTRAGIFKSEHLVRLDIVDSGSPNVGDYIHTELLPNLPMGNSANIVSFHIRPKGSNRLTPNETATKAHAIGEKHGADYVLFCEDDIDVCDKFLESVVAWLKDHVTDEYPLYPLCANYAQVVNAEERGETSWRYPTGAFYGTQGYVVPASIHTDLVKWLEANPLYKGKYSRAHDLRMHSWAKEHAKEHEYKFFLTTVPSFVQHVGQDSAMGCSFFSFRSWPGRNWSYQSDKVTVKV